MLPQAGQLSSSFGTVSPQFLQFIPQVYWQPSKGLAGDKSGLDLSRAHPKDQEWLSSEDLRKMRAEVRVAKEVGQRLGVCEVLL
jgi:hypothetical protein